MILWALLGIDRVPMWYLLALAAGVALCSAASAVDDYQAFKRKAAGRA